MDLELKGKKAIVTGGSRGLGQAIAQTLCREGARVSICARGEARLNQTLSEIRAGGGEISGAALDVRDGDAFKVWIETAVSDMGGLDILISNVSTRLDGSGDDWWRESFETDFLQHASAAEQATPHLAKSKAGAIVFLSTIASVMTVLPPNELAYGVMKAGLINYTGQLSTRLASKGIRVNAVSPGPIHFEGGVWDMIKTADPALFERAARLPALGRHGTPQEVANAVVFLASPAASYLTNVNLRVDGGAVKTANF
jgi:3-oxoacyl-[acyl-carrier protein] reductase